MKQYELIAPCHFGMEAVLKREIQNLGYEISQVDNGKVTFFGDAAAIARANIFLRTTERILLKIDSFRATSFDDLFEAVKAIPWADYIPEDGKFWVTKANSVSSKLFSPSDIQKIVKKAMVEKLKQTYHTDWFEETGASYPLRISIVKDIVTIGLDTTGESLHKRGYRKFTAPAPVTETLAAAMILLSPWHADRMLIDPFCGSGTIPIEAAMIALNMAPGMNREFTAESWKNLVPKKAWYDAIDEAEDAIRNDAEIHIQGYDIDDVRTVITSEAQATVNLMDSERKKTLNDISRHIQQPDGSLYVPGSSIKGVFRTAILYSLLQKRQDIKIKYWCYIKQQVDIIEKLMEEERKPRELQIMPYSVIKKKKNQATKEIDKLIASLESELLHTLRLKDDKERNISNKNAVCSAMRGLQVSDTYASRNMQTAILQKVDGGFDKFGKASPKKLPIFRECMLPEAELFFDVKIEKAVMNTIAFNSVDDLLKATHSFFAAVKMLSISLSSSL